VTVRMPAPMLELRGVTYRYPAVRPPALAEVDLVLAAGDVVGVTGPNDGGKSTLCLVAAGLAPGSIGGELAGEVRVDGVALAGLRQWDIASRVAIVFPEPASQLSGVTGSVFEEVAFGPVNLGCPVVESVARTERALERLGIADLASRAPDRLSGGQQQLVAIASMLAMEPRVLVLDEPVAELDPYGRRLVGEALRSLAAAGTTILIAEHDTDLLASICHRVVTIDGGRLS
jgi:energy-coupling factor transporter ATP-binding protein EcfA2